MLLMADISSTCKVEQKLKSLSLSLSLSLYLLTCPPQIIWKDLQITLYIVRILVISCFEIWFYDNICVNTNEV
jgi:hypothetical protein